MNDTFRSGTAITTSLERSAPAPSAPSGQWSTVAPGKWPPTLSSVRPPGSSRESPCQCSIAGEGLVTHSASAAWSSTGTSPSATLHALAAP